MQKCDACGGTYNEQTGDGLAYFHVCPPEVLVGTEKKPRPNIRNENITPGLAYVLQDGVFASYLPAPHPEERGKLSYIPATVTIIAEGAGRTQLDK
jgi:hypothetical protein